MKKQRTPESNYLQGWYLTIIIVISSLINIPLLIFSEFVIPLSSYLSLSFIVLAEDFGTISYYISALCIIPFVLCAIFGKKKVGWLIAALVLYAVDSGFMLFDFINDALNGFQGAYFYFFEITFHAIAIVWLGIAIKAGLDIKKERLRKEKELRKEGLRMGHNRDLDSRRDISMPPRTSNAEKVEVDQKPEKAAAIKVENPNYNENLDIDNIKRILTIERPASLYGKFASFKCFIDDDLVCSVANNDTQEIEIDGNEHVLSILASEMTGKRSYFDIKRGSADIKLRLKYSPSTQGAPKIMDVTNEVIEDI